jgi:hypothetical protein
MRFLISATILSAFCGQAYCPDGVPSWLKDAKGFCRELAKRTDVKVSPAPAARPRSTRFEDYATHPVSPQRVSEAVLGKYDWSDKKEFARAVKSETSKGPDFAGRYLIVRWSCGTWCSNATIVDVVTDKTYDLPFSGVVGCQEVTGDFDTMQRRADSSLLIVRGSLEMTFDHSAYEGPCGTFYFHWNSNRLRLIECDVNNGF